MNKELEKLYEKDRALFVVGLEYLMGKGIDQCKKITDEQIENSVGENGIISKEFNQMIVTYARDIAMACESGIDIIQFCMSKDVVTTSHYDNTRPNRLRMEELATKALHALYEANEYGLMDWEEYVEEFELEDGELDWMELPKAYEEEENETNCFMILKPGEDLKQGDEIYCQGFVYRIDRITYEEPWHWRGKYYIEFYDTRGIYRVWDQKRDGGYVERFVRESEKEDDDETDY